MPLHPAIVAYFDADRRSDDAALAASFAPDAVVRDEGGEHRGPTEILAWRRAARTRYGNLVSEPVEATRAGDRVTVRSRVSGDFPNSPVMLSYTFTLAGGRIATLDIG